MLSSVLLVVYAVCTARHFARTPEPACTPPVYAPDLSGLDLDLPSVICIFFSSVYFCYQLCSFVSERLEKKGKGERGGGNAYLRACEASHDVLDFSSSRTAEPPQSRLVVAEAATARQKRVRGSPVPVGLEGIAGAATDRRRV